MMMMMTLLRTTYLCRSWMLLDTALAYRGTSLIRNSAPLGPYSRIMPRTLGWSWGGGLFLMSEAPL